MSVFIDLIEAVNCGQKVHINLVEKTAKVNGNEIFLDDKQLIDMSDMDRILCYFTDPWEIVEKLYANYKRSVPSATTKTNKPYFKADSVDDLTDNEMAFNMQRDLAQVILESFVLLSSLNGWLTWKNEKHWFWQGKDGDLVILKEWI